MADGNFLPRLLKLSFFVLLVSQNTRVLENGNHRSTLDSHCLALANWPATRLASDSSAINTIVGKITNHEDCFGFPYRRNS